MTRRAIVDDSFALWSERALPESARALLGSTARVVGSGDSNPHEPLAGVESAVAIIASARIQYTESVMRRAPQLRVISRTGTGVDNIDLDAATRRRVVVCNVPDGPMISTAEHALALMLAVSKRLKAAEMAILEGGFDRFNDNAAIELNGLTLGLVGLGAIGRTMAGYGTALGMHVLAHDPFVDSSVAEPLHVRLVASLWELLEQADIVSLHAPLNAATHRLIDAQAIQHMRYGSILINTARGGLVDESAVADALNRHVLGGVGIDVFDPEPPSPANPLLGRPDVVATPHVAAATIAGRERLWTTAIAQALQVLRGECPIHVVNTDVLRAVSLSGAPRANLEG